MTVSLPAPLSGGSRVGALRWKDLYDPRPDLVWRRLRNLRHQPPGSAHSGERCQVFNSALEQAEELFKAAAAIGYASQPILLFYALSQAGRAIAASSTSATGDDWKLKSHGIRVRNLAQAPCLSDLVAVDNGRGSFTQLAPLLRSGTLPDGASLGELWATIPDLDARPIAGQGREYKNVLGLEGIRLGGGPATNFVNGNVLIAWIAGLPQRYAQIAEAELASYLAAYPTLTGSMRPGTNAPTPTAEVLDGTARVLRAWPMPPDRDRTVFANARTWPYLGDDDRYAYPALGGSDLPLYPLLAWWAILYTLSMLARYEPASWTSYLAVDSSPDAVRLEAVLSTALDACPHLILHAIRGVSRQPG